MRWDHFKDGAYDFTQGKTDKPLWIPLTDRLKAHLDKVEKMGFTLIADETGSPVAYRTVAQEMRDIKAMRTHADAPSYVTHGLRKNATIELYHAGCDDEMVKAVTGHSGVEMLKKTVGTLDSANLPDERKKREIGWNETRAEREYFNTCYKNLMAGPDLQCKSLI